MQLAKVGILLGICIFLVLLNTFDLQALTIYGESSTSTSTATIDGTPTATGATVTITATVTQKEIYYLPRTCLNGLKMCSDAALKYYAATLESYFTDAKQLPLAPRSIIDPTTPTDDAATDNGLSNPVNPPALPTTPTNPPNSTEGKDKNRGTGSTDDFDKTFGRVKTLLGLFTALNLKNMAVERLAWTYLILSIGFYIVVRSSSWSSNREVTGESGLKAGGGVVSDKNGLMKYVDTKD